MTPSYGAAVGFRLKASAVEASRPYRCVYIQRRSFFRALDERAPMHIRILGGLGSGKRALGEEIMGMLQARGKRVRMNSGPKTLPVDSFAVGDLPADVYIVVEEQ